MKFSENWLRQWVNPPVDSGELCRQLTMAGLEVDTVTPAAPDLSRVVVGSIASVAPHPQADELVVCTVDCGGDQPRNIVCGAPNARTGLRAPVALPGARLPAGIQVEAADLRGVRSEGMLCSGQELGLSEDADGLLELDAAAEIGTALGDHLELDDRVIEIDLTPDRGDCLSIKGVAREVGVWNRLPVTGPAPGSQTGPRESTVAVSVEDAGACPVYAGRSVFGVSTAARTPDWLCERLRRAGIRPIFPVVDVTNYVMLELGQPMHAFDQQALVGGVTVRRAASGEALTLLDDTEVTLEADTLVIADDRGPIAMAGVMGGARTGVHAETADIFLESACFGPLAVAGQGRRYKIHTDSLHRFERGVDPAIQVDALERATQLIQAIAGGEAGHVVRSGGPEPAAGSILLRGQRIERLLGTPVPDADVVDILERLDFGVTPITDGWQVTVPCHRYDIELEADLIEEVARIHGYDNLPARQRPVFAATASDHERQHPLEAIREILRQRGYDEAVTYSFVDDALQSRLDPDSAAVDLDNPIADTLGQMRTTLWSSLIPCWQHNVRRQQERVRLFEYGLRFERDDSAALGVAQRKTLAGLVYGAAVEQHWDDSGRRVDFFDVKGDVESLLSTGADGPVFRPEPHPALHLGRCARVYVGDRPMGWLGQLHPDFLDLSNAGHLPYLFELDYDTVAQGRIPHVEPVPEFPQVRRDLAFSVCDSVAAVDLLETLRQSGEPHLQAVRLFDVFRGGDLEAGYKSMAFGLIFQDKTSTLDAAAVDGAVGRLVEQVQKHFDATVRGQ